MESDPLFSLTMFLLLIVALVLSFMGMVRVIRALRARGAPVDDPAPPRMNAPSLFTRLREYGFTVCAEREWCSLPRPAVFGYAVCYGPESVYHCRACNQRGKHAFGETTSAGGREWCRIDWFGGVCHHCGHMERYASKSDGGGFFGLMLENGDSLLDIIATLDAEGDKPLLEKMERVLADREMLCMAKVDAITSLRKDLAFVATGAQPIPFRTHGRKTPFLS